MSGHIPIQFTVEITRPCNPVFPVYKGESFTVKAVLTDHGQPFVAALSDPKLYYQTADMGVAWWSLPATQDGNVVTAEFPANTIPNRERLNCFLGSAGENFHAAFTMDFRHSPGVTPNEIDLPVPVLNFAEIEVLNAPYYTTTEADEKFLSKDDAAAGYQPKGDYKSTQSPVADPTASQETSPTFIAGITQNEQGVIAPVKKTLPPFQAPLTFDTTPTLGSQNPVTSDGIKKAIDAATPDDYAQVKAQVQQNTQDIAGIEDKIPAQASAQNQLADKAFVNSSIATNTATFRGTYNLVSDLGLTVSATHEDVAAAIATKLASLSITPENNDYCFVQVPRETSDPTVIDRIDRYKCSVTESGGATTRTWDYEWSLNNSSFTADQWAAINSGITSGLVEKLNGIQAGAQVNTIQTVKVNGYALTPENKAVNVPVPIPATLDLPVIAGDPNVGQSDKFAREDHVHPAETKVVKFRLPDDCFPITYEDSTLPSGQQSCTIASNDGLRFQDAAVGIEMYAYDASVSGGYGDLLCFFDTTTLKYSQGNAIGLQFNGTAPTNNTWPVLEKDAVFVREKQVAKSVNGQTGVVVLSASDVGALGNSGNQTLNGGSLIINKIDIDGGVWLQLMRGSQPGIGLAFQGIITLNGFFITVPEKNGRFALLDDTLRFSTGVSYAVGNVVFYRGSFWRCTTAHTAGGWNASHFVEVIGGLSTGTPTAPNMDAQSTDGQVANKKYVDDKVAGATPNLDYVMRVDPETGNIYYTTPDTQS